MSDRGIAGRLVRRRVEEKFCKWARSTRSHLDNDTSSPFSMEFEDINTWRLMMQFLGVSGKLNFMQSHKMAWKIGAHILAWKHLAYTYDKLLWQRVFPFFAHLTSLEIDLFNPTFAAVIGSLQPQLRELALCNSWKEPANRDERFHENALLIRGCTRLLKITLNMPSVRDLHATLQYVPNSCTYLYIDKPPQIGEYGEIEQVDPSLLCKFEKIELSLSFSSRLSHITYFSTAPVYSLTYSPDEWPATADLMNCLFSKFSGLLNLSLSFSPRFGKPLIETLDNLDSLFCELLTTLPQLIAFELTICDLPFDYASCKQKRQWVSRLTGLKWVQLRQCYFTREHVDRETFRILREDCAYKEGYLEIASRIPAC